MSSNNKADGIIPGVLGATATSFLMMGFIFLLGSRPSMKSAAIWEGEFLVLNIPLYLLIGRSRRAWRANQSSLKGVCILGSILGGANIAPALHLLTSGGAPEAAHIEKLLLLSTLIVTVAGCWTSIFLFGKIPYRPRSYRSCVSALAESTTAARARISIPATPMFVPLPVAEAGILSVAAGLGCIAEPSLRALAGFRLRPAK
jgi:hypothetical protein